MLTYQFKKPWKSLAHRTGTRTKTNQEQESYHKATHKEKIMPSTINAIISHTTQPAQCCFMFFCF